MFNIHSVEIDWGGRPLRLETGKIARQADGAVLATYGETVVLATVVAAKTPREGVDFLPLTVDYIEKTYAAGRIPGGYFKREGRPTEKETLVSRLIDRPIRPLFADGWRCETQVIVRQRGDDHLRFTTPAMSEQRTDRAVDQAGNQRFLFGRTAFALEVAAGNAARGVIFFLVVDRERQEVDALTRGLGRHHGGEHRGLAVSGEHGAVGLPRNATGLQDKLA